MSAREIEAWYLALCTLAGVSRRELAELTPREVERRIRARFGS